MVSLNNLHQVGSAWITFIRYGTIPDECYSGWPYLMKVIQADHIWWRLFRLTLPDEGYSGWAYLMKVIQADHTWWRLFRLTIPDEGYSGWPYLMKVILTIPDEGYSGWPYLMKVIQADHTWWRLFRLALSDEGYSGWAYQMQVIQSDHTLNNLHQVWSAWITFIREGQPKQPSSGIVKITFIGYGQPE
jgi:hypothetical protein